MLSARFYRERDQLALRLDEEIRASLSDDRIKPVTDALEEVYGEFAIGKYPETREMRFYLGDVAAFSPGLIARLRRLVADEFPKWAVVPQFEECSFIVTALGVVFGDERLRDPITADTAALKEWWAKASEVDEVRYGPYRRQLQWLKPRILAAIAKLSAETVVLLGVFERLRFDGRAIWVLIPPNESGQKGWVSLQSFEAPLDAYPVDAGGNLYPQFTKRFNPLGDEQPAAWLTAFLTSVSLPGPLVFYAKEDQFNAVGEYAGVRLGPVIKRFDVSVTLDDRTLFRKGE